MNASVDGLPRSIARTEVDVKVKIDEGDCTQFTFVLYVGVFGVLCIFGLVGNTLSFLVLSWERHSHVATFLLQVMACADNLFLLTTGFSQIIAAASPFMEDLLNPLTAYANVYAWPLVHITQMWTVWITVLIAVNRFVAICLPFQAPRLCTMKQVRIQVVSLATVIVLYNIPRFLEYRIDIILSSDNNSSILRYEANPTPLKDSFVYIVLYETVLYCLFVFLGPLLVLILLNVCLVRELWRAKQRLRASQLPGSLANTEDQENNLTLVMIVIILIFLVCQTPGFLNQVLYYALGDRAYMCGNSYYFYYHLSNIVISANSSVNFVVYCVFRRQFRGRLRAFCGLSRRHRPETDFNGRCPMKKRKTETTPSPPLRRSLICRSSSSAEGNSRSAHVIQLK